MNEESGAATIEALLLSAVLLVPLLWMLTVAADLHAGALGTTAAARDAGMAAADAVTHGGARVEIERAVQDALRDHGLESDEARVRYTLPPDPRSGWVEVSVAYPVHVLHTPLVRLSEQPVFWIEARHSEPVDRYRSR